MPQAQPKLGTLGEAMIAQGVTPAQWIEAIARRYMTKALIRDLRAAWRSA